MKFFNFTELGSCCRAAPPPEETKRHVISDSGYHVPTSKRRSSNARCSAAHWRPALQAISEDGVTAYHASNNNQTVQKKSSGKAGHIPKATRRYSSSDTSNNKDSRTNSVPVINIPAFSPTPFVF
ncbi:hypothetical protein TorRG33x02_309890 [Trema orientale]|uniref:Uncharacterized protein n=2 Tax=Cannabaceae TaxID=3481 RepID=A0A2P5BIA4_PARAD|nr:hypothetical protein PanWU01x14_236460 [Parasponia andersonii]PON51930.1 hypothetical protein TorRG33x02_309890 [Trema orientale]